MEAGGGGLEASGVVGYAGLLVLLVTGWASVYMLVAGFIGLLRRGRPAGKRAPLSPRLVELVLVTKASYSVLDVLEETIRRVTRLLPEYKLWIVTDEGAEGLKALHRIVDSLDARVEVVVVPASYNKGRYKARALNYFIEKHVDPGKWYVFLDDDSYPLDRSFLEEIGGGDALVYQGILAPRRGKSLLSWLADAPRYYHEVSRNRVALGLLGKPIYGLHGELLIVHGSVLKEIGFATDSLAEDTWFAAQLIKRGIRVRQVSTRVSILSPNSVVDMWKQRARWNLGVLRDIVRGRYPPSLILARGLDAVLWLVSPAIPVLTALSTPLAGHLLGKEALTLLAVILTLGGLVPHSVYPALTKGVRGLLLAIAAFPAIIASIMLSTVYAIANLHTFTSTFVIVDKSLGEAEGEGEPLLLGEPAQAPSVFEALMASSSYRHEARWLK